MNIHLTQRHQTALFLIVILLIISGFIGGKDKPKPVRPGEVYTDASLKDISKLAKTQNKPYIVFVNDHHCNQCNRMDSLMNLPEIAQFLKKHFIVKDYDASNFSNLYRASNWGVTSVPTFVVFSSNDKVVTKLVGAFAKREFLGYLNDLLKKMYDANNQYDPKIVPNFPIEIKPAGQ